MVACEETAETQTPGAASNVEGCGTAAAQRGDEAGPSSTTPRCKLRTDGRPRGGGSVVLLRKQVCVTTRLDEGF